MGRYDALVRWAGPLVVLAAVLLLVGSAAGKPGHGGSGGGAGHSDGKRRHGGRGSGSHHPRGAKPSGLIKPGTPIHIGLGFRPQVLVDEAGVAHITYASPAAEHGPAGEHTYTAGWDNYCRLSRGAGSCDDHARLDAPITYPKPDETGPFFENSPGLNQDIGEGAIPLATGNQLALLAHRPGNVVEVPGGTSEDVNFLWTSDDGGRQFTGPGLTSTMDYYGGAVAYGDPASIGIFGSTGELIGDPKTLGHVFLGCSGMFDYPTQGELVEDDPVHLRAICGAWDVDGQPGVGEAADVEVLFHHPSGAEDAEPRPTGLAGTLRDRVGDVEKRHVDSGLDVVGHPVHEVRADQHDLGSGLLAVLPCLGQQPAGACPVVADLAVSDLGEVE